MDTAVGNYELRGSIGAGGSGEVFLAVDRADNLVAVKMIHRHLCHDEVVRARLAREFEIALSIDSVAAVQAIDADPQAARPWLATEYVPGPTLGAHIIEHGPLEPTQLNALAVALLEAIDAMHRVGIVHRDIKPNNVIISPDGPRLIDLGIALSVEDTRLTDTGAAVGTPSYMAPETIRSAAATTAVDVFGWGATIYYAATGKDPFGSGNVAAVMHRVLTHDPPMDEVHKDLVEVLGRCLDKEPENRPEIAEILTGIDPGASVEQLPSMATNQMKFLQLEAPDVRRGLPERDEEKKKRRLALSGQFVLSLAVPLVLLAVAALTARSFFSSGDGGETLVLSDSLEAGEANEADSSVTGEASAGEDDGAGEDGEDGGAGDGDSDQALVSEQAPPELDIAVRPISGTEVLLEISSDQCVEIDLVGLPATVEVDRSLNCGTGSVTLANLETGQPFGVSVVATAADGGQETTEQVSFSTPAAPEPESDGGADSGSGDPADIVLPPFIAVTSDVTSTSATINMEASECVEFAATASGGTVTGLADGCVATDTFTVTGLAPDTSYTLGIIGQTDDGRNGSVTHDFSTAAATTVTVRAAGIEDDAARLEVSTSPRCGEIVSVTLDRSTGRVGSIGGGCETSHVIALTDLDPDAGYTATVRWEAEDEEGTETVRFSTDAAPPTTTSTTTTSTTTSTTTTTTEAPTTTSPPADPLEITDLRVVASGPNEARVTYSTNECVRTEISYRDLEDGVSDSGTFRATAGSACKTSHEVLLGDVTDPLRASTRYEVAAEAASDGESDEAVSTVTTGLLRISNLRVVLDPDSAEKVGVRFDSNVCGWGNYEILSMFRDSLKTFESHQSVLPSSERCYTSHGVDFDDLFASTDYGATVVFQGPGGGTVSSTQRFDTNAYQNYRNLTVTPISSTKVRVTFDSELCGSAKVVARAAGSVPLERSFVPGECVFSHSVVLGESTAALEPDTEYELAIAFGYADFRDEPQAATVRTLG